MIEAAAAIATFVALVAGIALIVTSFDPGEE